MRRKKTPAKAGVFCCAKVGGGRRDRLTFLDGVGQGLEAHVAIAATPAAPYYAVIFTSLRTQGDEGGDLGYGKMAEAMEKLAATQPGFLGIESARDGLGITVSYWESLESIAAWKQNSRHLVAQAKGRERWYEEFKVRICRVERAYDFRRA
jgi:heme-degrading monooxygenase HmoA